MQKYSDLVLAVTGAPLRGASITVKTYPAGATATIYSDNALTPAANPLTSDVNGRYSFYAADGRYSLDIAAAGFATQTISDVLLEDPADGSTALAASSGATLVGYLAPGTGAIARTVSSGLGAIARSGDYDTPAHFNTAGDALTETIGMRHIRIGTAAAGGTMVFPARTTGRGQQIFSSFDLGPFLGDPDPVVFWGYNCTQTAGFAQAGEPRMYWAVEGYFNDGTGEPKMESYLQIDGLIGQGVNQFRPYYCIANRNTAAILVRYASDLHQFFPANLTGGTSVLDIYGAGTNGILAHKKVTIDTIAANSGLGLTLADNSGTPITVNFTPSWSVNGGAPALVTGGAYGISISAGGTENLRMPYISGAVNFIVAHGAATTGISVLTTDGSDTDVALGISSKGTDPINLYTGGAFTSSVLTSAALQAQITHTANAVNNLTFTGGSAAVVTIGAAGSATDVDIAITPKGAGLLKFGTNTAKGAEAFASFITIKDAGGTSRKVMVCA